MKETRREFVRDALGVAAMASLPSVAPGSTQSGASQADAFYSKVVRANDEALVAIVERLKLGAGRLGARAVGEDVATLVGSYCAAESAYFRSDKLLPSLEAGAELLMAAQHGDGTIDSGNYNSPPDTGFVVQEVCTALTVLRRMTSAELGPVVGKLERFVRAAGEALVAGGIHTPNHRWVVSSALAQVNALFPDARYIARVDDWLGEGIYCDADGQFSERSTGIYSRVVDHALITMARLLGRPQLLEPVRRNLAMNVFYLHPNGEVETVGSRRQDELALGWISNYYLQYRYMAVHDRNRQFAGVARLIEQIGLAHAEVQLPLAQMLEEPAYREALPEAEAIDSNYAMVFANSSLARVRRGSVSATVYGGSDWPLGVASGLASNPTFFTFRKGHAVLESVRMIPNFFSMGPFRSAGMKVAGNSFTLQQELEAAYYQPLPKALRNASGDYALSSADGRFWSKMNFAQRPKSNVQRLDQRVVVSERDGVFELAFDVSGHERVPVTIELALRKGGRLKDVDPVAGAADVYFLRGGTGRYTVGADTIRFGPGQAEFDTIPTVQAYADPYTGAPHPGTYLVYVTAYTPLRKTVTIG